MSRAETGKMRRVQHPHCVRLSPGSALDNAASLGRFPKRTVVMKWPRRLVGSATAGRQAVQETGLLHVAAGLGTALVAAGAGAALAGGVGPHHSALAHAVMAHAGGAAPHRALVRVGHTGLLHVVGLRGGAGLVLRKGGAAHEAEGGGRNDELLHLKLLVGCVGQRERRSRVPKTGRSGVQKFSSAREPLSTSLENALSRNALVGRARQVLEHFRML